MVLDHICVDSDPIRIFSSLNKDQRQIDFQSATDQNQARANKICTINIATI